MRKMAKLNVAIADDNERILTMLDEVLTADDDITVVGTARNGEQAYEMILDKKPDTHAVQHEQDKRTFRVGTERYLIHVHLHPG